MNIFAAPLLLTLFLLLIFFFVLYFLWLKDTEKKKKFLIYSGSFNVALIGIFFLFGPLFAFSPIKIGYKKVKNNLQTIYYPNSLEQDKENIIILVNMAKMTSEVMAGLHNVKVIIRHGIGYDNVDVEAATANGIIFANEATASSIDVAEATRRSIGSESLSKICLTSSAPRLIFLGIELSSLIIFNPSQTCSIFSSVDIEITLFAAFTKGE